MTDHSMPGYKTTEVGKSAKLELLHGNVSSVLIVKRYRELKLSLSVRLHRNLGLTLIYTRQTITLFSAKKYHPSRQRLTLPQPGSKEKPIVLHYKKSVKRILQWKLRELNFSVQGPGSTSFLLYTLSFECLGPLIIYPVFYYFPVYQYFGYKGERVIDPVQMYALYYWCFHYFKNIMETFFVHRFSHATFPLSNVYRNCAYYWTFGAYIAYYVNHPLYTPVSDLQMKIGFGFGLVCQLSNFYCHILLRNLRSPSGNGGYQIPRGFLLDLVTCANYTTEIYQWLGFNIAKHCCRFCFPCGCCSDHD